MDNKNNYNTARTKECVVEQPSLLMKIDLRDSGKFYLRYVCSPSPTSFLFPWLSPVSCNGSFANKSVWRNDSLTRMNWPDSTFHFSLVRSFVLTDESRCCSLLSSGCFQMFWCRNVPYYILNTEHFQKKNITDVKTLMNVMLLHIFRCLTPKKKQQKTPKSFSVGLTVHWEMAC